MGDDGLNWEKILEEAQGGEKQTPHPIPSRIAAFIIDEDTVPSLKCPDGHVIEWTNKESGVKMAAMYRFAARHISVICLVCGYEEIIERAEEPNGETEAGSAD